MNAANLNCVLIYDGECGYCLKQIARMKRWDRAKTIEFVPRQSSEIEQRFPWLLETDFNTGMRLVDANNTVHVGADAVYQVARRLSLWRWCAWVYVVPGLNLLWRAIYRWIAKNRYRLAKNCTTGCELT